MIIRILVTDDKGSIDLNYDDSKENPFLPSTAYGDPPVDNDTLHSMLEVGIAGYVRKEINSDNELFATIPKGETK